MNSLTDQQLLRDYAERRSEAAFAELVRRHIDFVYSAALRMVRNAHLAEDVTQNVFVALSKNASQLTDRPVLSGWLHRTAQNLAANAVRTDVRRRAREQEAVAMNELLAHESDATWENIAPHLDTALGELSEPDRDALLLRYFERKSAREMAQTLGTSEEAAQKRVNRAVERLREFFSKRNATVGASGLVVLISANGVQAAPLGLFATISSAVFLAGIAVQTSTAIAATKTIVMTTLQKTLITATIAVAIGTGIYEARRVSNLQKQIQTLRQGQAPLAEQLNQTQSELKKATNALVSAQNENELLRRNTTELPKLRGQVAQLKNSQTQTTNDPTELAAKAWTAKVNLFKQYLEQNPSETIPEIELADDRAWLQSIDPSAPWWPLETEKDYRQASENLRLSAEGHFGSLIANALMKYYAANNKQFPTDLSQLQPYCAPEVKRILIDLYKIAPAKIAEDVPINKTTGFSRRTDGRVSGDWVITRKVRVNSNSTSRLAIFTGGSTYWQSPPGSDDQ